VATDRHGRGAPFSWPGRCARPTGKCCRKPSRAPSASWCSSVRVDDAGQKTPSRLLKTALGLALVSHWPHTGPRVPLGRVRQHPAHPLALNQGGYDWGYLAFTVGFGGSMIWSPRPAWRSPTCTRTSGRPLAPRSATPQGRGAADLGRRRCPLSGLRPRQMPFPDPSSPPRVSSRRPRPALRAPLARRDWPRRDGPRRDGPRRDGPRRDGQRAERPHPRELRS
jgi:hypothetical protein